MRTLKNVALIALVVVGAGCKKGGTKPVTGDLEGNYKGTLYADEKDDAYRTGPITANVSVSFNKNAYSSITDGVLPASIVYNGTTDTGKFVFKNKQLVLTDSLAYPDNFDHNLIFTGTYSAETKGDSLLLVKTVYNNTYTYKLKKQ